MGRHGERAAGEVLDGRYKLVERLGRGGFGDVWRAEELLPDGAVLREVALKLLLPELLDTADWSAEARIIASLRHPALCTIYAAGVLEAGERLPFVAMELLIGQSLGAYVDRGERVPWRRVLYWAREAAAALDTIHRAGVVHLDLKPANLFLPEGGKLKVLDFGIARQGSARTIGPPASTSSDDLSTAAFMAAHRAGAGDTVEGATSHRVVGTPGFMAPEIFEDGEATAAADAYALAGVMVQLCTGELPQRVTARPDAGGTSGSTALGAWLSEVQAATVRGHIRDLGSGDHGMPDALVSLLERWLALDPDARGIVRGGMREALDEIWRCPSGRGETPYRGLASYRLEDDGHLYGRSADIARIARELYDQPCVIMQGEGGVGLESLALAGVVPALAKQFADDRHDWQVCQVSFDREQAPDAQLRAAIEALVGDPGDDPVAALCAWAAASPIGVVVVLDDLHQLIGRTPRALLSSLLSRAAPGEAPAGLRLLGTLRAEHTAELLSADDLAEGVRPWLRFITSLQASMVDEIVHGPARAAGRRLIGGDVIAEELGAQLAADGMRLGLVSLALTRWWTLCGDGPLSAEVWREHGGVLGFAVAHAESFHAALDGDDKQLADAVMLRLVSVDGSALEVPTDDVLNALGRDRRAALSSLLDRLVAARLLIRVAGVLRLGHPGFAEAWRHLHDLRLHDMDRLSFLEELRGAARRWVIAGRPGSQVWSGEMVRELRRRGDSVTRELGDDERAFVAASERGMRITWTLRALAVVFLLSVVAGVIWVDRTMAARERAQREQIEAARVQRAISEMVTLSRRTSDPYQRVALLAGAIEAGSADPLLPLELAGVTHDLPASRFFSLTPIAEPMFPWGERWLIGGSGEIASVLDFDPPAGEAFAPVRIDFRPHEQGMYDYAPIPFGDSFVTRGLDGTLKVWRLRDEGSVVLAAVSPMKCVCGLSQVVVARRAPVIACTTVDGVALWDLRQPGDVYSDGFVGRVLDVSDDGSWLAAARLRTVLLWNPGARRRHEHDSAEPPSAAAFSPRDPLIALSRSRRLEVWDLSAAPPAPLIERSTDIVTPVATRWAPSGVDVAVCSENRGAEWHYLRRGGRADDDPPPPQDARPCEVRQTKWPEPLNGVDDYGDIGFARLGPRQLSGGWRRENGMLITRDLVAFDPAHDPLARIARRDDAPSGQARPGDSASLVHRVGDDVVWQVGDYVRIHDMAGKQLLEAKGQLLAPCPDGRLLALREIDGGKGWQLFGARHDVALAKLPRQPGFVLGADAGCRRVWFQGLDGTLLETPVGDAPEGSWRKVALPGGSWVADGYVYDARPSGREPAGLWLALSEGGMLRIEGAAGTVSAYGHATPRASAMADGPEPGDLLFADDTGVILRRRDAPDERLLEARGDRVWSDIAMLPGRNMALLSWSHGVALLDLTRREIVGSLELPPLGRLAPWDARGSTLVWSYEYQTQPKGVVIPFDSELAAAFGAAASNLRAVFGSDMRPKVEAAQPSTLSPVEGEVVRVADGSALGEIVASMPSGRVAPSGRVGSDSGVAGEVSPLRIDPPPPVTFGELETRPQLSSPAVERACREQIYWHLRKCTLAGGALPPPDTVMLKFSIRPDGSVNPASVGAEPASAALADDPVYQGLAECVVREFSAHPFRGPPAVRGGTARVIITWPSVD